MNNNSSIVIGSLGSIAKNNGQSLAETFLNADVIVLADTSGSMGIRDSRGDKSRYEVLCEELSKLQASMPGKIAVCAFSDETQFCPSGVPFDYGAGTDLATGLRFIKIADVTGMKFILISDGNPNDEAAALKVARTFKNHIDVIYVGPENRPDGRDFLNRLAHATGGQQVTADRAKELRATVTQLLQAGK